MRHSKRQRRELLSVFLCCHLEGGAQRTQKCGRRIKNRIIFKMPFGFPALIRLRNVTKQRNVSFTNICVVSLSPPAPPWEGKITIMSVNYKITELISTDGEVGEEEVGPTSRWVCILMNVSDNKEIEAKRGDYRTNQKEQKKWQQLPPEKNQNNILIKMHTVWIHFSTHPLTRQAQSKSSGATDRVSPLRIKKDFQQIKSVSSSGIIS